MGSLYVHLGHTASTGWQKKPFFQFHPMLHSKVYYMEFPDSRASAFIGSHIVSCCAGLLDRPNVSQIRHKATAAPSGSANVMTFSPLGLLRR